VSDLFAPGSGQQAHARRSDPQTSHRAAEAVTPGLLPLQATVERFAVSRPDGFMDVDLVDAHPDTGPSTLRTRRSELTARNIILDSGKRKKPDGATVAHTVWIHRSFVPQPPEIKEAPTAFTSEDREAALVLAGKLDNAIKVMRDYGLVGCMQIAEEAATTIRKMAR
jgi:hypothetical protein